MPMRNSMVLSLPALIFSIQQRCIRFLPAPRPWGLTERYIGSWLTKRGRREELILASKAAGPADWPGYCETLIPA